jgi:predicted amidohydrolase YtcJ
MAHLLPEKKGEPNDFYDIIGIKHWYDGSPYTGSMYLREPYLNTDFTREVMQLPENYSGIPLIPKEELQDFIRKYHENGWQIAFHVQGDAATQEVIDAFANLESELSFSDRRHRLEHNLLLPSEAANRIKKLGLTPSFHINHLLYYGDALEDELLGTVRAQAILPVKTIKDAGIPFSLHADQPMFESNPFRLIQTAVERKTTSGRILGAAEKIKVLEALKAMTINAAWQIHKEDQIGTLEPGKYADFIVLDKNPLEVSTNQLGQIKCLQTYVNGNLIK